MTEKNMCLWIQNDAKMQVWRSKACLYVNKGNIT
jgi:hypothetical protein